MMRRARALWVAGGLLFSAAPARADVRMTLTPLLGPDAPIGDAWGAMGVMLEGATDATRGTVEIRSDAVSSGGYAGIMTSVAPFSLQPGVRSMIRVPVAGARGWQVLVTAKSSDGTVLAAESLRTVTSVTPLLVDVSNPSRLVGALRGAYVRTKTELARSGTSTLTVGSVLFDETTGDPVLPERAAEYGGATVVAISSDLLVRLGAAETDALAGFVLAGGTLALSVARPEDLRHPTVVGLLGGEAHEAGPASHLQALPSAAPDRNGTSGPSRTAPPTGGSGSGDDDDPPPVRGTVRPGSALRDKLVGYAGGNLVTSDFGATAAYGLGEVHVLPADFSHAPALDDPWTQSRLVELVRHAWDRRASIAFLQGGPTPDVSSLSEVRKSLDPNEGAKWTVLVAAILLVGYAVIAGPVNFSSATRAGKPLRALRNLPIFAAIMFVIIVMLGVATRGIRGQARRLSLLEVGGGLTKGTIRRYRGFFTSRASSITLAASSPGAVIALAGETPERPHLTVERGGLRLEDVATLPWQTIVAREDDVASAGGGVALIRQAGGDVQVVNHLGRDLRGVVAWVPRQGVFFHPVLKDGASLLAASGHALATRGTATGTGPHALALGAAAADLDGASPGLAAAWGSVEAAAAYRRPDYWPDDVPVVVGQIDGGDGVSTDAGLSVDRDRALLRVVGYGGAP